MIGRIRILAGDWDRLQRVHQGREPLASELLDRGRQLAAEVPVERLPADAPLPERLDWLTRSVPRRAASIATLGYELVMNRGRLERSTELEKTTYERDLELQKDIVPPLKEEARALRDQIRRLERELVSRGGDPTAVPPAIPPDAIAVEDYQRPEFQNNESRRRATVEFFRRVGGDRL